MKDRQSTFLSTLPLLIANLLRHGISSSNLRHIVHALRIASSQIPTVSIRSILRNGDVTVIGDNSDSSLIAQLVKGLNCAKVFEFGTYMGKTAMAIAVNCPNATVVTLDLPDAQAGDFAAAQKASKIEITDSYLFDGGRGCLIGGDAALRIRQLRIDSREFDSREFKEQFDLIYIDASHSYSAVKNDTEHAFVMVKRNGVIVWDDYVYPGVWRYLNELAEARPELGLKYLEGTRKVILHLGSDGTS